MPGSREKALPPGRLLASKPLTEKQGRPVARSAQMETANAKRRPAMSVPKSFGTGGALAARHVPCLAKTTHVLHVISLVGDPDDA
jgi:hypothetical protein